MVTYALPVLDVDGSTVILVPLTSDVLGYAHVFYLDENDEVVHVANVPPAPPPLGKHPTYENGQLIGLTAFVPVDASGEGPSLLLDAYVGRRVTERWRMVQLGDHSRIEFELYDDNGPVDLTGALLLEVVCRRADRSVLTRTASMEIPTGGTVPSRVVAQLDTGDVQSFGEWLMQAHVVLSGGHEFRSAVRRVVVEPNV